MRSDTGNIGRLVVHSAAVLFALLLAWQVVLSTEVFPPARGGLLYALWHLGIILPIHEAGHLLFSPFGYAMTIFGGSFWQVAIPLLLVIVAFRQGSFWWTFYLSLTGVHLIDLTPYIFDAPFRSLQLITGRKDSHDWANLLNHFQVPHMAEPLSDVAFYGGIVISAFGMILAVIRIIRDYRGGDMPPVPGSGRSNGPRRLEDALRSMKRTEHTQHSGSGKMRS